ncbi:MAG: hypothetical protein IJZ87_01195, partial [Bacteroidales bacterium]|nr:hypothetical protein [Bacteroidales bacterium]
MRNNENAPVLHIIRFFRSTDNRQQTSSTVAEPVEAQIVEELGIRSEELGIDSVAEPVEAPGDVV